MGRDRSACSELKRAAAGPGGQGRRGGRQDEHQAWPAGHAVRQQAEQRDPARRQSRRVVWIVWAYTPDWVLESLGVTYYPDRYWAIALPMFGLSLVCYLIVVYNAWNLCNTHPFHSYYTIQDSADMATRVKDRDMHAFQATDSIPP